MEYHTRFILLIFFLPLQYALLGQPGFNKLLDAGFDKNHFRDMIVVNDTIIGYGIGFDSPMNGNQGVILAKIDSFGNLLDTAIILDSLGDPLAIDKTWGRIIPTQDGGFAMTAATAGRNSAFLIKTDWDFNVEFVREYLDTINLSNFQYFLRETEDGYLLYGAVQAPNLLLRPFIRRVDGYGGPIWHQYYGNPSRNGLMSDVKVLGDGTAVATANEHATADLFGPIKSVFRKVDVGDGSVLLQKTSAPDPDIGYILEIEALGNGGFLTIGAATIDQIGNTKIVQTALSRLDGGFNTVWTKKYGRTGTLAAQRWFWDFEPTLDGHYIASGEGHVEMGSEEVPSGWLMKFSVDGDSIWSRYDIPDFPVDSLGDTFFGGVGVLSSGSIVAGGTATLWNGQSIWLVKVGADGCMEVSDCGLVPVEERESETEGGLVVYPNPANETLTIRLKEGLQSDAMIGLYNFQGELVLRHAFPKGSHETMVGTGNLPEGLYLVKVTAKGMPAHIGKVTVSH